MYLDRKESAPEAEAPRNPPAPPDTSWLHDDEPSKAHGPAFWAGMVLLVAVLAGLGFAGYSFVREHKSLLNQFAALPQLISTLGDRMTKTEENLRQWAGEQQGLRDHVSALQNSWEAKLRTVRRQTQQTAEELFNRARAEAEGRASKIDARLAHLESTQESEQAKLARLESEVAQMLQTMAAHESQIAAAEQNSRSEREDARQRLGGLDRQIAGNKTDTDRLARSVEIQRVDFQLAKNRSQQLTPGITVRLTRIDVTHQRVKGWIEASLDPKTAIPLRDQPVNQPVVLYTVDGKRRDVVFTRVGKNITSGYVLLSSGAEPPKA